MISVGNKLLIPISSVSLDGKYQTAVTYNGYIYVSDDYGDTWTQKDSERSWRVVSLSSTGQYQTATTYNGYIYVSDDYGDTWTQKDSERSWYGVSVNQYI